MLRTVTIKEVVEYPSSCSKCNIEEQPDALLQHIYHWLCSPQSKLHDPALHRVLQKVMHIAAAVEMNSKFIPSLRQLHYSLEAKV